MLGVIFVKNKKHIKWLAKKIKEQDKSSLFFFNIIVFDKASVSIENLYPTSIRGFKTLEDVECGYDFDILDFTEINKIYNYNLGYILNVLNKRFNIIFEQIYDIDEYSLKISIFDKKDLIYDFIYNYDNIYNKKTLYKIIKGDIVVSKEREKAIIDAITERLSLFGVSLSNYSYSIEKKYENTYEVSLENENDSLILIKNIKLDDNNFVLNVGENKGLVL